MRVLVPVNLHCGATGVGSISISCSSPAGSGCCAAVEDRAAEPRESNVEAR